MFFIAREYHSFTVSVRVPRLAWRNTPGTTQGPWVRLSPLQICPMPRLDFSLRRGLAPTIAKATTGGAAMSLARRAADAMIWGRSRPGPSQDSLHFRSARRQAARDSAERAGTPGDGRSWRQAVRARHGRSPGPGGDGGGLAGSRRCDCKIAGIAYTG